LIKIRAFFLPYIDQRSKIIGNESPIIMPEITKTKYLNLVFNSSMLRLEKIRIETTTNI
jgi:hypothetical protein